MEEKKPEEKKPGFIEAMSIWTYWKLIQLGIAVVKALKMLRKK